MASFLSVKRTLLKQLGVIRLMDILQTKGQLPITVLGSLFATRASDDEQQAVGVGLKFQDLLSTLREFPYLFIVVTEGTSCKVHLNYNQQSENVEGSLALASGCLKIRDVLESQGHSTIAELYGVLSTKHERDAWGGSLEEFQQTVGSLPGIFCVNNATVSLDDQADMSFIDQADIDLLDLRVSNSYSPVKHNMEVSRQKMAKDHSKDTSFNDISHKSMKIKTEPRGTEPNKTTSVKCLPGNILHSTIKQESIHQQQIRNQDTEILRTNMQSGHQVAHCDRMTADSSVEIKKMFQVIEKYLRTSGIASVFRLLVVLFGLETPSHAVLTSMRCQLLKQHLEQQSDVFYVVRSFAAPEHTVVCLQDQKSYLDLIIDSTVAFLLDKGGKCSLLDLELLLNILPSTPKLSLQRLGEILKGLDGIKFRIDCENIVLCNYDRWTLLLGNQSTLSKESSKICKTTLRHDEKPAAMSEVSHNTSGASSTFNTPGAPSTFNTSGASSTFKEELQNTSTVTDKFEKQFHLDRKQNDRNLCSNDAIVQKNDGRKFASAPDYDATVTQSSKRRRISDNFVTVKGDDKQSVSTSADNVTVTENDRRRSTHGEKAHGKCSSSKNRASTYDYSRVLKTAENTLKASGVQTVKQLWYSLENPGSLLYLKNKLMDDREQRFCLIKPASFSRKFDPGQEVVCLKAQEKIFWESMEWVEQYIKDQGGSCRLSRHYLEMKKMLDLMPYYMNKLYDNKCRQLWFSIFATVNRTFAVDDGRLVLLNKPSTQKPDNPEKVMSAVHVSKRIRIGSSTDHTSGLRSVQRKVSKPNVLKKHNAASSNKENFSPLKISIRLSSSLPLTQSNGDRNRHARKPQSTASQIPLKDTYKTKSSRKRKRTNDTHEVEAKKKCDKPEHMKSSKKRKRTNDAPVVKAKRKLCNKQENKQNEALDTLKTFLCLKGPRTCEQMFSFIHNGPKDIPRTDIKNDNDLLKLIKSSTKFHILSFSESQRNAPDAKTSLVCLPHQRYHFETGVQKVIEYVKKAGGSCLLNDDCLQELAKLMPSSNALGSGSKCLKQTLNKLCGVYFQIKNERLSLLGKYRRT